MVPPPASDAVSQFFWDEDGGGGHSGEGRCERLHELDNAVSAGHPGWTLSIWSFFPSKAPYQCVRLVRETPSTSRECRTRDTLRQPSAALAHNQRATVRASGPSCRVSAAQVPV